MLVMKGLTVKCQKSINKILIARPDMKKVTIGSISWEGGLQTRLSEFSYWNSTSTGLYEKEEALQSTNLGSIIFFATFQDTKTNTRT